MGQALIRAAAEKKDLRVVAASERAGSDKLGKDAGDVAGIGALGVAIAVDADAPGGVWIDFTSPDATTAALGRTKARAAIVGTTGLEPSHKRAIAEAAKRLTIVQSGNFSLGVNLLAALTEQAAARLGVDWDIEILEAHHRRKVDAPSGTALLLGEAAAKGRGEKLEDMRVPPHNGITGPRTEGAIGFASQRGGGQVGEHEVMFVSERELIRLSHVAMDRALFADGALVAAKWAADKAPGLYSMRDVLGL
jgi:4-hydroxy-tetrahydrodipicolinate reductase